MSFTREQALSWVSDGTALFNQQLDVVGKTDTDLDQPCTLPGWTRKNLLAHVGANAAAISNLVTWARTGIETPMYSSKEQRQADIDAGPSMSATELLARHDSEATRLEQGWSELTEQQWQTQVKTAQGRDVPAEETPWMRAREVMIHAVDLGGDIDFSALPPDFLSALMDDICNKRSMGNNPALTLAPTDVEQSWQVTGDGEPVAVSGPLAQLAAWLAGRDHSALEVAGDQPLPELPAWL